MVSSEKMVGVIAPLVRMANGQQPVRSRGELDRAPVSMEALEGALKAYLAAHGEETYTVVSPETKNNWPDVDHGYQAMVGGHKVAWIYTSNHPNYRDERFEVNGVVVTRLRGFPPLIRREYPSLPGGWPTRVGASWAEGASHMACHYLGGPPTTQPTGLDSDFP